MRFFRLLLLAMFVLLSATLAVAQEMTLPATVKQKATSSTAREAWKRLAHVQQVDPTTARTAVSLSSTKTDFGFVPVGTISFDQLVMVTNTGSNNLAITRIEVDPNFLVSDTCSTSAIAPNGSCSVFVSFAPAVTGAINGTLTITDNTAEGSQTIGLTGTGSAPKFSAGFLSFPKQALGTTSPAQTITVTNIGATALHFSKISASAGFGQSNTCGSPLAPQSQCTISVTSTPTQFSGQSGILTITDDAPGGKAEIFLAGEGSNNTAILTTDLTTLTATDLVNALLGSGVTASNITYTGASVAAGKFSGGSGILGLDSGVVLSSGAISNVIGPNKSTFTTANNGTPGDTDLNALVTPNPTFDAAVLQFDFLPTSNTISFQYVFASEEYNEFANSSFNDVFAFFVNGTNVAVLPGTQTFVSINNVNGGNPLGTNPHNPQFYVNNDFQLPAIAPFNTEMDGLTVVLTVQAPVNAGQMNHIKLAIADTEDSSYDSNVFIGGGSLTSASVTLAPQTLAFGSHAVNSTSAAQTVVLTNGSNSALLISSISASTNYAVNNQCPLAPATLAAGGQCNFSVTFTPTSNGLIPGTVTVTHNGTGSPQSVTLSGTGTGAGGAQVSLSPPSLTFASQVVGGTSAAQIVTLTNTGTGALTVTSVTPNGDFADTTSCVTSSPIAPNGTCTISVTFVPTVAGPRSGSISIVSNATGSPHTIGVTGTATDFSLSLPPGSSSSAKAKSGDRIVFLFNLGGSGDFGGTVTLDCTPVPPQPSITCSVEPTSVTLTAGSTTLTKITLNTFCSWNSPRLHLPWNGPLRIPLLPGLWLAAGLGLMLFALARRKGRRLRMLVPAAMLVVFGMVGCANRPKGPAGATPPGTYTLAIHATSQGVTHTVTVTLIVE
jgi:hypothetical protein